MAKFSDWLDDRTGYRKFRDSMLLEHVPGGAKWRYIFGSMLAFVFVVQAVTGILLMTAYSPGESTAWGSVYFIQYEMDFGWLIRGLHHFGSQTMVVLLALHMLQVVIAGAHLPPREVNWWLGLLLMGVVFGLSLTGYLLPWDQKGYWATQVATGIAGSLPGFGPSIQKIVVGGEQFGHHTLTHFYALHVAILPSLLVILLIAHIAVFRRHGVTAGKNPQGMDYFWPAQVFRDLVGCLAAFAVMLALAIFFGHGIPLNEPVTASEDATFYDKIAKAGQDGYGVNLDAPADPTVSYPPRPEWYFLFLFQMLKYFEGDLKVVGTVIVPAGVFLLLFILPLLGYGRMRIFGHLFGVLVIVALIAAVGVLTYLAIAEDAADSKVQEEFKLAHQSAVRAVNMASHGIPEEGGKYLLRRDPQTRGAELFAKRCAVCHIPTDEYDSEKHEGAAPDLLAYGGFGSEEWIYEMLRNPGSDQFFGRMGRPFGRMAEAMETEFPYLFTKYEDVKGAFKTEADFKKQQEADLSKLKKLAAWLASHPRKDTRPPKKKDDNGEGNETKDAKDPGPEDLFEIHCKRCHVWAGIGRHAAPNLTGYGDPHYLRLMITQPNDPKLYGIKNRMPMFRDFQGKATKELLDHELSLRKNLLSYEKLGDPFNKLSDEDKQYIQELWDRAHQLEDLSDIDRELIIRYMMEDPRVVFAGDMPVKKGKR